MNEPRDISDELQELKRKEKYLEVINSFATILLDAQSIHEIVWSVARHAIAKLNYYDCVIYLYDAKENKLIQSEAFGPKNPEKEHIKDAIKLTPGLGIVGEVFTSGKGEYVNDTSKDKRYIVDDEPRYSELTVPLTYKGEVVGVIDSEHPDKNFFTDQDFDMLTTVAAMVSTKLAQAKANEELLNYQENLEDLIEAKTQELTNQNKEKEILIKEIHHRVKNNMQIMISLLNLKINTTKEPKEQDYLREFQDRIRSMAIIHERLYLENDISLISIDEYIHELSESLFSSLGSKENIVLKHNISSFQLHIDYAIPLGLIINEMITNSIKHGFAEGQGGSISLQLVKNENEVCFEYSDDGKGFNPEEVPETAFGTDLIEILASQLNAKLSLKTDKGVHYTIEFETDDK
ncbi:MAG: two-component sensor histidine kinase/putative methionine-R-sulfoxide reductase with GAF domain [Arenicella sp.]|jgi:two-component sensor histidine kinase/putative methionine-R-sulfoxide reductase with GAF domain